MPCHGTINLTNDPSLFGHTKALKGFLAQQIKEENPLFVHPQLYLDIEAVNKATITACQYVDWLLSTINPNAPHKDTRITPDILYIHVKNYIKTSLKQIVILTVLIFLALFRAIFVAVLAIA